MGARLRRLGSAMVIVGGAAGLVTAAGSVRGPESESVVITPVADVQSSFAVLPLPPAPVAASRYRVVQAAMLPRPLPPGRAPERGLQVRTIRIERAVSAVFPEIREMGGVRPDALRWHPEGLAVDVMIPNAGSPAGIALGNQIVAYALKNAERFGLQDAIWRGTYYTPSGSQTGGYGHFDHVHLTSTGGGYPTGGEVYFN